MSAEQARAFDWRFHMHGDPELRSLFSACGLYASRLPRCGWLTLSGGTGCGKTHLARRMASFWNAHHCIVMENGPHGGVQRVKRSEFVSWSRVVASVIDDGKKGVISGLSEAGLLVIDDIGSESLGTAHRAESSRSMLIDALNLREGRPTVITSNASMDQLGALDDRITSRLTGGGEIFESKAGDYRLRAGYQAPEPPKAPAPAPQPAPDWAENIADPGLRELAARVASKWKI